MEGSSFCRAVIPTECARNRCVVSKNPDMSSFTWRAMTPPGDNKTDIMRLRGHFNLSLLSLRIVTGNTNPALSALITKY